MFSVWTKHLNDEQKEQFENSLKGSKPVLDRAVAILKEEYERLNQVEMSHKIYELPNWDYRIAHDNGFRAGITTAMKLLDLDQQKQGTKQ